MWDYCTPGPEALHKEVINDDDENQTDDHGDKKYELRNVTDMADISV